MEKLKALFGDEALTYEQLSAKLKDSKEIKLANLAEGGYVDKAKFDAKQGELDKANETITGLQESVKKFDGVDVETLKKTATEWETKYNSELEELKTKSAQDLAAAKLDNALNLALVDAKAKDPKLVKTLLDMNIIKQEGENLVGLKEQLEGLTKTHDYLFTANEGGGSSQINSGGAHAGTGKPDFSQMSDTEYFAYIDAQNKK